MAENEKGLGDLGGLLSSLMSNPAALSGIMGLLGNLQGTSKPPSDAVSAGAIPSAPLQEEAAPTSALPLPLTSQSRGERERRALLCAIRPYLSKDKCETLDKLLGLYEVFAIFSSKGR